MMFWRSFIAVAVGGLVGCLLRWFLALLLNRYFPTIPPGTLAANLIGCYIIGLALAVFAAYPAIAPERRLLMTTGICCGVTIFWTSSAEIVLLLQSGRLAWAVVGIAVRLVGSFLMPIAGIAAVTWMRT